MDEYLEEDVEGVEGEHMGYTDKVGVVEEDVEGGLELMAELLPQ